MKKCKALMRIATLGISFLSRETPPIIPILSKKIPLCTPLVSKEANLNALSISKRSTHKSVNVLHDLKKYPIKLSF